MDGVKEPVGQPSGTTSAAPEEVQNLSDSVDSSSIGDAQDFSAISDDGEEDEDMVEQRRAITQERLLKRNSIRQVRSKLIPFHWAPMLSPLTASDIETSVVLEDVAFKDVQYGATREQIEYRIRKCASISFGLFNTYSPDVAKDWWIPTMQHCRPVETGRNDNAKRVMFAHAIATLGEQSVVTDNDTRVPENWRDARGANNSVQGHQFAGKTICLHSFAVCPGVQGVGIGKSALKAYLQLVNESGVADRVALICKPTLVDFFKKVGFEVIGPSQVTIDGGNWQDMVFELPGPGRMSIHTQSARK